MRKPCQNFLMSSNLLLIDRSKCGMEGSQSILLTIFKNHMMKFLPGIAQVKEREYVWEFSSLHFNSPYQMGGKLRVDFEWMRCSIVQEICTLLLDSRSHPLNTTINQMCMQIKCFITGIKGRDLFHPLNSAEIRGHQMAYLILVPSFLTNYVLVTQL